VILGLAAGGAGDVRRKGGEWGEVEDIERSRD
jgi:hypothetical protein